MITATQLTQALANIYHQFNLFDDAQLPGYFSHFGDVSWGGHKQLVEGGKTEQLAWLARFLTPHEQASSFDHFEYRYHPYRPGIGIDVVRQPGERHTLVHMLPGRTTFCVFAHDNLPAYSQHRVLQAREALPPPVALPRKRTAEPRGSSVREAWRVCCETNSDDILFDCPHCGGEYCWRCRDEHISECAGRKA
jgi:hypothetical protein